MRVLQISALLEHAHSHACPAGVYGTICELLWEQFPRAHPAGLAVRRLHEMHRLYRHAATRNDRELMQAGRLDIIAAEGALRVALEVE